MRTNLRGISRVLFALMAVGTACGLIAGLLRLRVEMNNRRIEIGLEWQEVSTLAQSLNKTPTETLALLDASHAVSTLILQEDTISQLEQTGAIRAESRMMSNGKSFTEVSATSPQTLERIRKALELHEYPLLTSTQMLTLPVTGTLFTTPVTETGRLPDVIYVPVDFTQLHTLGVGLPQEGIEAAKATRRRIAGRIGNFPGITQSAAENVLKSLRAQIDPQGAEPPLVIFSGEETLGYRGLEGAVAEMLRDPNAPRPAKVTSQKDNLPPAKPVGLTYGAVEFSKQKGEEKLSATLNGDYVRVHSIQTTEMGQLTEEEIVERYVRAARERNIRFCYVRLLTFAGSDRLGDNAFYLDKIAKGMVKGSPWTGRLDFASLDRGAKRYTDPGVPKILFLLTALGVAAGTVWMLKLLCPLPEGIQWRLLALLGLACAGMAMGESGRKLVALLAGIVFPAAACLLAFPRNDHTLLAAPAALSRCMENALRVLVVASLITAAGIAHVIGLLAARAFMVHAEQFVGIKAQHAVPLFIVVLAALLGGTSRRGESWEEYRARAVRGFHNALNEPARFGTLIFFIVALAALALVVARTGNDAGVGVSGIELKSRALLDRILPVRPRTKEFLVGHPLFVLGIAWWLRGRRKLALPCFVAGSLGQVSLLNTFCHIHTPLLLSLWRDLIGLVIGAVLGLAVFWLVERLFPVPVLRPERAGREDL